MDTKYNDLPVKPEDVQALFSDFQDRITLEKKMAALVIAYVAGFQQRCIGEGLSHISDLYYDWQKNETPNYVDNIMAGPFRNTLSTLMAKSIEPTIIPKNMKDDFTDLAEIYTRALNYHRQQIWKYGSDIQRNLAYLVLTCGTAYTYTYPSPDKQKTRAVRTADGKILTNYTRRGDKIISNGQEIQGQELDNKTASLSIRVYNLWDVAHSDDGQDRTANTASWTITQNIVSLGWIAANYAKFNVADLKIGKEALSIIKAMDSDVEDALSSSYRTKQGSLQGDDRQVKLLTMYHKPDNKYPKGWRMVIACADKPLLVEFMPSLMLANEKYTISPIRQWHVTEVIPTRPVQLSPFSLVLGLQIAYNKLINSRIVHENKLACPPRSSYKGAEFKTIETEDGPVTTWGIPRELETLFINNPTLASLFQLKYDAIPPVSGSVIEVMNRIKEDLINTLGTALANPGPLPAQLSGVAIENQAAVEQAGQVAMIKAWNALEKQLYLDAIKAMTIVYTKEELAYMLGEESAKLDQLYSNDIEDSFDIDFADQSQAPATPLGKLQQLMQISQVIPPDKGDQILAQQDMILKSMGFNLDFSDIELELAEKENDYIINYVAQIKDPAERQARLVAMVNPLQNDDKHNFIHKPICIGPKVMDYTPEQANAMSIHIQVHEQAKEWKIKGAMPETPTTPQGDNGNGQTPITAPAQ